MKNVTIVTVQGKKTYHGWFSPKFYRDVKKLLDRRYGRQKHHRSESDQKISPLIEIHTISCNFDIQTTFKSPIKVRRNRNTIIQTEINKNT